MPPSNGSVIWLSIVEYHQVDQLSRFDLYEPDVCNNNVIIRGLYIRYYFHIMFILCSSWIITTTFLFILFSSLWYTCMWMGFYSIWKFKAMHFLDFSLETLSHLWQIITKINNSNSNVLLLNNHAQTLFIQEPTYYETTGLHFIHFI